MLGVRDAVYLVARLVQIVHLPKHCVLSRNTVALSIYHYDLVLPFYNGCVCCFRESNSKEEVSCDE